MPAASFDDKLSSTCYSRPSKPATLLERIWSPLAPLLVLGFLTVAGLPGAIKAQVLSLNPFNWFNPFRWHELILANGFGAVLASSNKTWAPVKAPLLSLAHGRVLEVGAGSGENVAYYDREKVEELVCLEPFESLRIQLAQAVEKAGLKEKTTILPLGLSARHSDLLSSPSIQRESFDTIVLVQVLCSIPQPKEHLTFLQSLLKPGGAGQILLFEHVASKRQPARKIQEVWTVFWRRLVGGCELARDSAEWMREVGGWKEVQVLRPREEHAADLFPHAVARYVKA